METAISIPDPLFASAEELASRLHLSRSELYAYAVEALVNQHRGDGVTAALNAIYDNVDSRLDPAAARLQAHALPQDEW